MQPRSGKPEWRLSKFLCASFRPLPIKPHSTDNIEAILNRIRAELDPPLPFDRPFVRHTISELSFLNRFANQK
ncbi:MAG: hypothetical protein ACI9CB_002727 [Rhodothermales bacterium]|jgi:hypothetical protein